MFYFRKVSALAVVAGGAMIITASTSMAAMPAQGAPSIGEPTNPTATVDYSNATIKLDWDAPTGGTVDPERYGIFFALDDLGIDPEEIVADFAVTTGDVGDAGALDTEFTLSKDVLEQNYPDLFASLSEKQGLLFSFYVRSDNDSLAEYAESSVYGVQIDNGPSNPDNFSYERDEETGDLTFSWDLSDTRFVDPAYYRLAWSVTEFPGGSLEPGSYLSTQNFTGTTHTIEYKELSEGTSPTDDGTYYFTLLSCSQFGNCSYMSGGLEVEISEGTPPTTTTTVPPTTTTTVPPTTTTTTLPPTTELPATGSSNGLVIYVLLLLTGGGLLALSARHRRLCQR